MSDSRNSFSETSSFLNVPKSHFEDIFEERVEDSDDGDLDIVVADQKPTRIRYL
jgi:hypothetical protein